MKYDVAVIGASAAGLHAAKQLALGGCKVAVYERKPAIQAARRTLIITPHIRTFISELPDLLIRNRISLIQLASRGTITEVELQDPDLVVERSEFISWQLTRAENAGVDFYFGYTLENLTSSSDSVRLDFQRERGSSCRTNAGAVIGADGAFSRTAWLMQMPRPEVVPIIQGLVRLPDGWDPSVVKVIFEKEETPYFYWLIPESCTHGVVGLIGNQKRKLKNLLDGFMIRHQLQLEAYEAGLVAMYRPGIEEWKTLGSSPVLLVGDAAGHVKVSTVGGLVAGIWGAEAAAKALLGNRPYSRELAGLKKELNVHWLLRGTLNLLSNRHYDILLSRLNGRLKHYLSDNNRDNFYGTLGKLLSPEMNGKRD